MIRTLPLVCSNCDNKFVPAEELYYRDNFMSNILEMCILSALIV